MCSNVFKSVQISLDKYKISRPNQKQTLFGNGKFQNSKCKKSPTLISGEEKKISNLKGSLQTWIGLTRVIIKWSWTTVCGVPTSSDIAHSLTWESYTYYGSDIDVMIENIRVPCGVAKKTHPNHPLLSKVVSSSRWYNIDPFMGLVWWCKTIEHHSMVF